jgi:hypothetical protein
MGWLTSALALTNDYRPLYRICNITRALPRAGGEDGQARLCPIQGAQATVYRFWLCISVPDLHAELSGTYLFVLVV